jgi:hypothetical protein
VSIVGIESTDVQVILVRLVHLVRLQTENFCLFLCQQTDKTNFRLYDEQTLNGSSEKKNKSPGLSFSNLDNGTNGNFRLFTSTENGNGKLVFVSHKRKWKMEDYPWSAIDKR